MPGTGLSPVDPPYRCRPSQKPGRSPLRPGPHPFARRSLVTETRRLAPVSRAFGYPEQDHPGSGVPRSLYLDDPDPVDHARLSGLDIHREPGFLEGGRRRGKARIDHGGSRSAQRQDSGDDHWAWTPTVIGHRLCIEVSSHELQGATVSRCRDDVLNGLRRNSETIAKVDLP